MMKRKQNNGKRKKVKENHEANKKKYKTAKIVNINFTFDWLSKLDD